MPGLKVLKLEKPTFIRKDNIGSTTDWIMSNFQTALID